MIDKLLIIGNGFDLYCNLPTKFSDYYSYKKTQNPLFGDFISLYRQFDININDCENRFFAFVNKFQDTLISQISIWDLYFCIINQNEVDINWFNIEQQISESLPNEGESLSFWEKILSMLDDLSLRINTDIFKKVPVEERLLYMIIKYTHCIKLKPNKFINYDKEGLAKLKAIKCNWQEFLFEQLCLAEKGFKEYIAKIEKDSRFYPISQNETFEKLLKNYTGATLMSFNYTSVKNKELFKTIENVHGKAAGQGDIIFGIDNTKCEPGHFSYIFTKTYRKVSMYLTSPSKVINEVLSKDINQIVFFGHSLNEQDYSYFQAIFDYFDLYSNTKIKLDFRYSIYDANKKKEIEKNLINGVISLLDSYGKTLDNKYKGRNLIHKLLNESRLTIKLI